MEENSIEKDEEILNNIKAFMQESINKGCHKFIYNDLGYDEKCVDVINAIEHILSEYKRVLKENEELTISNKEIDKECSRLEKKEVELINENEHYKDLIYALKTYYDITEEDLEKCMKNDR